MPGFNPFNTVTGKNSATLFEIRLDSDVLIIMGNENEAASQILSGSVVLCLPAPLKVEDVHLRMTGLLRVGWIETKTTASGVTTDRAGKSTEIFSHRWSPFVGGQGHGSSSKAVTLPAGNHEWPFELVVPGHVAESVEGLTDSHIIYRLKATVARGKLAYDLHAYRPVRIIRTLDPSALELAHAMAVENVWPNKVEYSMNIPQKAILFGTAIEIDMRFTSLLKGLKIGCVKCILTEIQEFTIPGSSSNIERYHRHQRDIGNWEFEVNDEDHYHDMIEETMQDGYVIKEKMPLPKRLKACMQDVDIHGIRVRHKVKFNVALHNPDGHISELRATLPVTIFISPNMPIDEHGNLVDQTPSSTQSANVTAHAPPLYGEHVLDQIYADINHNGMMTPGLSGMSTPALNNMSRRGSSDNLTSLDRVADGAITADALSSRLHDLNASSRNSSFLRRSNGTHSEGNTPLIIDESGHLSHSRASGSNLAGQRAYFDLNGGVNNASRSGLTSTRTSEEGVTGHGNTARVSGLVSGQHSPEHSDYSDLDLNQVPSYSTAVKAPPRGLSYSTALPNYETAISVPPSPTREHPSHDSSGSDTPGLEMGDNASNNRITPGSSGGI